MKNSILSYSYASNEIKGYKKSKIAQSEKNDCFVRAVASATGSHYDSAHSFVKETFDRKNRKGTMFMEGTMKELEKSGFSKFQKCTPWVEIHHNIYARYSGIEEATGDENPHAEYDADDNTIYVYYPQMKSRRHVIETLLHEYKHYLQSPSWMKRYRTMGHDYFTHPYEIEALKEEKNWKIFS